jgi:transcriptional regulator with XRE-family HTH domain
MAKPQLRARARELRRAGRTYPEIAAGLGVSKSSVSLWVRDVPVPPRSPRAEAARLAGLRRRAAERRVRVTRDRQHEKLRHAVEVGPLTDREVLIAGAVAYWAEGSKAKPWRPEEAVRFVNSDPRMIQLFLATLDLLGVDRSRLRFQIAIHETADTAAAETFWAAAVGIPVDRLSRTVLKRHRRGSNRKNLGEPCHGCLCVRVLGPAPVYRQLEGVWWAVSASVDPVRRQSSGPPDARQSVISLPPPLARFRAELRGTADREGRPWSPSDAATGAGQPSDP